LKNKGEMNGDWGWCIMIKILLLKESFI
jgi:hypothetical protein